MLTNHILSVNQERSYISNGYYGEASCAGAVLAAISRSDRSPVLRPRSIDTRPREKTGQEAANAAVVAA